MPGIRRLFIGVCGIVVLAAGTGLADTGDSGTQADAVKRGEEVFSSHGCGYCHESGGRSAGKGPQLMRTARDDSFITFRIMNGKEGQMPAFSGSIDADQLTDLIAYIRSLKD